MLNFAVWALALVHGLTAGTDATTAWALTLYIGSAWSVLTLFIYRLSLSWESMQTSERST
jgi:hypothetical protein